MVFLRPILSLSIPKGINNGQRIRVPGKGQRGLNGGPNGDLYIEVVVAPHDQFKRENNDIHLTIPVDFVDACLGTTIVVPTIYGDETLEIPSGTQPNAILKMRNKGVKDVRSDRYGDQFVHVDIKIPTKLSKEHHYKIIAVHLNHNWRGDESDKEEENCKKFCEEHDLTFYSERLPDSIKKSETAAREARQKFFKKCCEKFNAEGIFLAHNKSDNTETVIFRIAHGTGVKGLCGITEYSQIFGYKIYRPLLTWSRQDVEEYCKTHNLTPNNDSSNSDTKYNRNFLRHKVIKDLKQINEDIDSAVMRLSEIAQSEQNIINEYLNKIRAKIEIDNKIKTGSFLNLSYDVQKKFIHEFFIKNNLEYDAKKNY